ncbi:U1 small nuclear ribonucleoprotein of 70kDa MW N terminal-domain-containing protein [Xylariales sp. AK1849]|nr:U1 small nuclear ribonucleoprotein of 70kDa MW N terminal-domain-containing protein [Xylariales sp. AK1849]
MTDKLPPQLLALFAPRPPLRFLTHVDEAPEERKTASITGLAGYLPALNTYKDNDDYQPTESWLQVRDRKKLESKEKQEKLLTEGPLHCGYFPCRHCSIPYSVPPYTDFYLPVHPDQDPNIRGDAFKTLIVARLSYEATGSDLEREFGRFGPIERIRIITDTKAHERPNKKKKPHRGYAFVVFEREKDMRGNTTINFPETFIMSLTRDLALMLAYLFFPSQLITSKVDVERGRTVKGWKPRRLGGGLGGRGYTKAAPPRPSGPGQFGGGFGGRDGFRGGFQGGSRGRGGFRGNDRGFRGGGGGGFGGGRDRGFGQQNGFGAPPNAPAGPGSGGRGGFGGDRGGDRDRNGSGGGYDRGGGRSFDDRSGGRDGGRFGGDRDRRGGGGGGGGAGPGGSNANYEPVRGGRDRDFDRPREDDRSFDRKRGFEGGYEDPRKLRRY